MVLSMLRGRRSEAPVESPPAAFHGVQDSPPPPLRIVEIDTAEVAPPPERRAGQRCTAPQPFALGVVDARSDPDTAPRVAGPPDARAAAPVPAPAVPAIPALDAWRTPIPAVEARRTAVTPRAPVALPLSCDRCAAEPAVRATIEAWGASCARAWSRARSAIEPWAAPAAQARSAAARTSSEAGAATATSEVTSAGTRPSAASAETASATTRASAATAAAASLDKVDRGGPLDLRQRQTGCLDSSRGHGDRQCTGDWRNDQKLHLQSFSHFAAA